MLGALILYFIKDDINNENFFISNKDINFISKKTLKWKKQQKLL